MAWSEPKSGTISGPSFLRPNRHPVRDKPRAVQRHIKGGARRGECHHTPARHQGTRHTGGAISHTQRHTLQRADDGAHVHQYAELDNAGMDLLRMAMERFSLSARAYSRILKVARTIADLDASDRVQPHHLAEAIGYRNLDRGDWAER